jgi:hypothetical protein
MTKRTCELQEEVRDMSTPFIKQAFSKYTFDFTLDEVAYRAWYDSDKEFICFDCGSDLEESLRESCYS